MFDDISKVGGEGTLEGFANVGAVLVVGVWDGDFETFGMEIETVSIVWRRGSARRFAINSVPKNRSAKIVHVDAELVSATRDGLELDKRMSAVGIEDAIVRLGRLAAGVDEEGGRMLQIPSDREVDEG